MIPSRTGHFTDGGPVQATMYRCGHCKGVYPPESVLIFVGNVIDGADGQFIGDNFPEGLRFSYDEMNRSCYCRPCAAERLKITEADL